MTDKKETKAEKIKLSQGDDFKTYFTDFVKIQGNPETVTMTFCIKEADNLSAVSSHQVIMTTPHFMRLTDICETLSNEMKSKIKIAQSK